MLDFGVVISGFVSIDVDNSAFKTVSIGHVVAGEKVAIVVKGD